MKLKKIASVALAGVMAVGVLAGCGANSNANSGNTNTDTTTSTAIVDVVNKAQDSLNQVKINFTASASLDKDLKTAVNTLGLTATGDTGSGSVTAGTVSKAITNMNGLQTKSPDGTDFSSKTVNFTVGNTQFGTFLSNAVEHSSDKDKAESTYTVYGVVAYEGTSYPSEEAAMNKFAEQINTAAAALKGYSDDTDGDGTIDVSTKEDYFAYTYDGNVSIASVAQTDGTVDYFVAFVINQNVATKTL